MSGIAGIVRLDGKPIERQEICKMTEAMAYRGPDGATEWIKGPVGLGQCMLRTTAESLEEIQPLANEDDSVVLVMDGRADNWEELRQELLARGAALRTRSDAELVLRAYETWGHACLAHIDGDFAIAIWDERRREVFCVRDRLGLKPLHYHWDGKALVFASDLRAILAMPWVSQTLNEGMLAEFLADEWYSRDETLWSGVMRLPAAHCMSVTGSGPSLKQYWAPDLWAELPLRSDEEYFEYYRELFTDIVRRRCRSHRLVAFEVSGGLDSSAVFCVAERLRVSGALLAPGTEGYTLDFSDDPDADELSYARALGKHVGRSIHEIKPSMKDISWYSERANIYKDFPGFPNGVMFVDLDKLASARGATVIMSGLGGDQFLWGSRAYYEEEFAGRHWAVYECFATDAKTAGAARAAWALIRRGLLPLLPELIKSRLRRLEHMSGSKAIRGGYWLSSRMRKILTQRKTKSQPQFVQAPRRKGQLSLQQALYYPFDAIMLEQRERLSASSGLEVRHPFFASAAVQFAFSTPERLRLRGNQHKYIHARALQGILPETIRERTTKSDFGKVFFDNLQPLRHDIIEVVPVKHFDWVDYNGVARLFQSYLDCPDEGWQNWILWQIIGCHLTSL